MASKRSYTDEEAARLRHEYESESRPTIRVLATNHGRNPSTILNMLRYAGTELRAAGFYGSYGSGGSKEKKKTRPQDIYDKMNYFQREVVLLVSYGFSNDEIAEELRLTKREVTRTLLAVIAKFRKVAPSCVNRQSLVPLARSLHHAGRSPSKR